MSGARLAAARVLTAIDRGRTTFAAEIDRERPDLPDRRDRALLFEITAGTLRWRNELDALLEAASGRAVRDIDSSTLTVLRLAAYQLRHLTRVPPHAVVHESVETIRVLGSAKAAGFVNAVLRALVRKGRRLSLPRRPAPGASDAGALAYLTTTLSHPEWLVRRWLARRGFEATERWCQFNDAPPDVTVRSAGRLSAAAVGERLQSSGISASPARFAEGAWHLPRGALGRVPPDLADELVVQAEESQLVAQYAGARAGEQVLDLCAAPGGKTLVMAAEMAEGRPEHARPIVAADHRPARVALLARTVSRAAHPIRVVRLDAREALPFGAVFDCVLVDAPCSGLGTLRRDPDLKWSRLESDLPRHARDARGMLDRAATVVRPGGRIIYATCSSEPDENQDVVAAFLDSHPEFTRRAASVVRADVLDSAGQLVTDPVRHDLDAFFAAALVRRGTA